MTTDTNREPTADPLAEPGAKVCTLCNHPTSWHGRTAGCTAVVRDADGKPVRHWRGYFENDWVTSRCGCDGREFAQTRKQTVTDLLRCACGHEEAAHPPDEKNPYRPCRAIVNARYFTNTVHSRCPCPVYTPEPTAVEKAERLREEPKPVRVAKVYDLEAPCLCGTVAACPRHVGTVPLEPDEKVAEVVRNATDATLGLDEAQKDAASARDERGQGPRTRI